MMFFEFPDDKVRLVSEKPSKEYLDGWMHCVENGCDFDANPYKNESEQWWDWFYGMRDALDEQ